MVIGGQIAEIEETPLREDKSKGPNERKRERPKEITPQDSQMMKKGEGPETLGGKGVCLASR